MLGSLDLDVSRETADRLRGLERLIGKWTKSINLISPVSSSDIWERHILDSAQLWPLAPQPVAHWLDLGSGGGLPGLVLAAVVQDLSPETRVTLIESDRRKAIFLSEAKRQLGLECTIINDRIEQAAPQSADVISARALAPLPTLIELASPHLAPDGICLFPKGRRWSEELSEAKGQRDFEVDEVSSNTDPESRILRIGGLRDG